MPQTRRIALVTLLAALVLSAPSIGQTVIAGATPGGAFYTIAVPDAWNGGLVIYNHGFTLTPGAPGPDLGPLVGLQIVEGYAVAASSYRQVGWAVFDTVEDNEELYDVFVGNFGTPQFTIVYGPSLGGLVTVQTVEKANVGNVVGAMPFCGALAGSRNWHGAVDLRLLYDFICGGVPGAAIPGGAGGIDPTAGLTPTDTVTAANVCFGHDLPQRSPDQQARLDRFLAVSGLPQSFINTSLGFFATFGMADLVFDPDKMGGQIGVGNRNVDYGDPGVNAGIARVGPRKAAARLLRRNYTPNGNIGNTKVLSMHTSSDGLILVENETAYAQMAPPDLFSVGIVQEATPTHCGFSTAELVAGWETLRGWIAGDPQPNAFTLQVVCLAFQNTGTFDGPCRFNPFFPLPDPDGRFRPRQPGNAIRATTDAVVKPATPETPAAEAPARVAPAAPEAGPQAPQAAPAPRVQSVPARASRIADEEPVAATFESRQPKRFERQR